MLIQDTAPSSTAPTIHLEILLPNLGQGQLVPTYDITITRKCDALNFDIYQLMGCITFQHNL